MKKYKVWIELVVYVALPLGAWYLLREPLGEYAAMLISTVPGLIYSIAQLIINRKINVIGLYIVANLMISTLLDVLAGSALQMLYNQVYYMIGLGLFVLATIAIRRPILLYAMLDMMETQGMDRDEAQRKLMQPQLLKWLMMASLVFVIRDFLLAGIKYWLIQNYGVDAFDKGIVIRQVLSWSFILIMGYYFYLVMAQLEKMKESEVAE